MKKLIAVLLVCLFAFGALAGCNGSDNATPDEVYEAPTDEVLKTYDINTKIATLKFPERWKDIVTVETLDTDPYTVVFSANGVKVFELYFNGTEGDILGTLITDDGQYLVSTKMVTVDEKSENYETYRNVQEDVNIIMDGFAEDYTFVPGVDARDDEEIEVYAISTPLVDLYYPVKWQDRVTTDVSDSKVSFSCDGTPLFDIMFGGDKGNLVGRYDGTDILIVDYPLEDQDMKNMQEDVNVILNYLQKDEKFTQI